MKSDSKSMTREDRLDLFQRHQQTTAHGHRAGALRRYWSATSKRRNYSVTFDISSIEEDKEKNNDKIGKIVASSNRRMSAPELPPISARGKNSPTQLILQGAINQRLNNINDNPYNHVTSARSNSNSNRYSYNHSNNSEGSMRGIIAKSPQSGVSSSSGGQSCGQHIGGNNKVVNGFHLNRGKTWCVPDQTVSGVASGSNNIKLEAINNKRGMSIINTPRSTTKHGYRSRMSSKDYSATSSGNNNSPPKKSLTHCKSDPKIVPIEEFSRTKTFVKRNSDMKLKSQSNQRLIGIDKMEHLTRNKTTAGNVNGLRRYSSTYVLDSQNKTHGSEDSKTDEFDDSDSDSSKDQFIIDWIIGLESEEVEDPPEPDIEYLEHPPQTDTAVHIVYDDEN